MFDLPLPRVQPVHPHPVTPSSSPSAECFPSGVYWLSIGQLDRSDLLARLQTLCFRLEQSQELQGPGRTPGSLEEAKERLRFLLLRRFPR